VWGQTPAGSPATFRIDSSLVLIRFHVQRDEASVTDLKPEDIELLEDGKPHPFTILESGTARTMPLRLTLLFDLVDVAPSFSPTAFDAEIFTEFLKRLPSAEVDIYAYDRLLMPFCRSTRDPMELGKALQTVWKFMLEFRLKPGESYRLSAPPRDSVPLLKADGSGKGNGQRGGYAGSIYDAAVAVAREQASLHGNATRAIMAVSAGYPGLPPNLVAVTEARLGHPVDPNLQLDEALPVLLELGTQLYPVRVHLWFSGLLLRRYNESRDVEFLARPFLGLGPATGGLSFAPEQVTGSAMRDILVRVAENVESEQLAAFRPQPTPGGPVKHRLEIRLKPSFKGLITGGVREVTY
jgi:hypothetical protein